MIRTKTQVYLGSLAVTVFACCVVATAIMFFYPRELWAWEFSISLSLAAGLSLPLCLVGGHMFLHIHELSENLRILTERDTLTEVATRGHFIRSIEDGAPKAGVSFMVDIDHFKRINDTFGHLAGDEVIRSVAQSLAAHCREHDLICRYGGEEFSIFLRDADPIYAEAIAERMRSAIADQAVVLEDAAINVTVSIGAAMKDGPQPLLSAIRAADEALYRAKARGRNCVKTAWRVLTRPNDSVEAGF